MTGLAIITRKAAIGAGMAHYFTGKPCKHGHTTQRHARNGSCLACCRRVSLACHHADPEAAAAKARRFMEANPGYIEANRERINANSRAYRERNKERYAMYRANRRAVTKRAIPAWFGEADRRAIAEAYSLAKAKAAETGFAWEVDHEIPLAGKTVCGLHVAGNIQVIPATANKRKSNKFFSETY